MYYFKLIFKEGGKDQAIIRAVHKDTPLSALMGHVAGARDTYGPRFVEAYVTTPDGRKIPLA